MSFLIGIASGLGADSVGPPAGSGGGGGGGFTPIETDLLYFLNAQTGIYSDAGNTEATDGQAIQQINDQSSAGIIATNTQVGYQATYAVASVNGLNSIRLENDNTYDTYFLSSEVALPNYLFTLHVVYKKDALSDAAVFAADGQTLFSDDGGGGINLLQGATYYSYDGGDDWTILSFIQDKSGSGLYYLFINGVLMKKLTSTTTATQAIDRLFQRPSRRIGNFNVGDMLFYAQAQSFADVATTQNGLNNKYGQLYLPIDTSLPTPPIISGSTLELYVNPDYNTYSDVAQTAATNLDYVRSAKLTTADLQSIYQDSAANQFQWKNTVMPSSKASLNKNVTSARYQISNDLSFGASESYVVYGVIKRDSASSTAAIIGHEGSYYEGIFWQGNLMYWSDSSNTNYTASIPMTNNVVVNAFVVDRSAGEMRVYENGTEIGTVDISGSTSGVVHNMLYNRRFNATGQMDYGITMVYRGLPSATDVGTVSDWLNVYYGGLIY